MKKSKGMLSTGKFQLVFVIAFIITLAGVVFFGLKTKVSDSKSKSSLMEMIDLGYCKEYNQSYNLNGYIITLKYGMYSEITMSGKCILEVEKENGTMEEPYFTIGNELGHFGNDITVDLMGTGTICSKAELMDNGKVLVYTEFAIDGYTQEEEKWQGNYQIFLNSASEAVECAKGTYGFKLENNISQKEYKTEDGNVIKFSSLGITIETGNELDKYKIEVEDYYNNKKTVYETGKEKYDVISESGDVSTKENDVFENPDIKGCYSQRYLGFFGKDEKYFYAYRYKNIYDISNIKNVYVNGKLI